MTAILTDSIAHKLSVQHANFEPVWSLTDAISKWCGNVTYPYSVPLSQVSQTAPRGSLPAIGALRLSSRRQS